MEHLPDTLARFLRAVHRRWIAVHVGERAGVGLLIGSAVGLILVPILLWKGGAALVLGIVLLTVGALTGALAGWITRPGAMRAAIEVDRQLNLGDLLGTAHAIARSSDIDPWQQTVLAMADARARSLSPNDVVLNRLGARSWGGIGLSAALVLTLGLMSTTPTTTVAGVEGRGDSLLVPQETMRTADEAIARVAPVTASPDVGPQHESRPVLPDVRTTLTEEPDGGADSASESADRHGTDGGEGSGSARTEDLEAPDPLANRQSSAASVEGSARATGPPGTSGAASDETSGEHDTGATTSTDVPPSLPPPWASPAWSDDRSRALNAVERGTIPDRYRPIVREYFAE